MITIISTILGLLSGAIPEIIKIFKQGKEMDHELKMTELQMKAAESEHRYKVEEINVQADISESEALYKSSEIKLTGSKILDGLVMLYNSSVRPTLTYFLAAFYGAAKYGQYVQLTKTGSTTGPEAILQMYNGEDMALFSTVIGYYFGQRGMRYAMERIGARVPAAAKPKI